MLVVVSVPVLNLKQSFLAAYLQQVVLCGECVDNSNLASLFAQSPDDKPVILEQWRERETMLSRPGRPHQRTFHHGCPKSVFHVVTGSVGGT